MGLMTACRPGSTWSVYLLKLKKCAEWKYLSSGCKQCMFTVLNGVSVLWDAMEEDRKIFCSKLCPLKGDSLESHTHTHTYFSFTLCTKSTIKKLQSKTRIKQMSALIYYQDPYTFLKKRSPDWTSVLPCLLAHKRDTFLFPSCLKFPSISSVLEVI